MDYDVSQFELAVTVWAIRTALLCMWTAIWLRLNHVTGNRSIRIAGCIWLLGALLSMVHFLAAMGFYHDWSHSRALEDTAAQTDAVIGMKVGIGIWFNYLFVMGWLVDAVWWNVSPGSHENRPAWIDWLVISYLMFIAFNGAIVFETGPVRWFTSIGFFLLAVAWFRTRSSNRRTEPIPDV